MRGIFLVLLSLFIPLSGAAAGDITVSRVQGDVQMRAGVQETWQGVKKGEKLKPHDSMMTGKNSTAVLLVTTVEGEDPVKINLPPNVILDLSDIRTLTRDELILKLKRELNVTSIVVTHDMHSAFKVADRIVMLHEGKFIFDGTPEEIERTDQPLIRQFVSGEIGEQERAQLEQ